jgi:hypothetical protein
MSGYVVAEEKVDANGNWYYYQLSDEWVNFDIADQWARYMGYTGYVIVTSDHQRLLGGER